MTNPTSIGFGNKFWFDESGEYHRDGDLPAMEFVDGKKRWYLNGLIYRRDEWIKYWL